MKWLFLFTTLVTSSVQAAQWNLVGQGTATWLWMDIYQAKLFHSKATLPEDFLDDQHPLKLELCYLKSISKEQLTEAANQNLPDTSHAIKQAVDALHSRYQSVKPGDCYQLAYSPKNGTQLSLNQQTVFQTPQAGFKAIYFGLWLGDSPLSEDLKQSLIGR